MKYAGTAIYVDDVAAALDFYLRAFGMETRFYDEKLGYGELETGGSLLAFGSHEAGEFLMPGRYHRMPDGKPVGAEVAFFTEDVQGAFEKAVAEGAAAIAAPKVMPWGATVAYLRAPEGTIIGLSTPIAGV
jgi:predicted enzyme related to lactoylglutathione lyase